LKISVGPLVRVLVPATEVPAGMEQRETNTVASKVLDRIDQEKKQTITAMIPGGVVYRSFLSLTVSG
jgi:hypothetical protein